MPAGLRSASSSRHGTELVASLPGFSAVTNVLPITAGASVARVTMLPVGAIQETITVGCSATGVAIGAPSLRQSVAMASPPSTADVLPARLRLAWNRVLQGFAPVLSAQQNGDGAPAPGSPRPPVRVGGNIRAPKKLANVQPQCPKTLIPATDTIVRVVGRIGIDGYVNDVKPLDAEPGAAPPAEFTESALDAVRQWMFTPTLLNGEPVEVNITVHVFYRRM